MSAHPEKTAFLKDIRSIRTYHDTPIDKSILADLVDAGRMAPTARNMQPWEFVVIDDKGVLAELAETHANGRFVKDAAAAIMVLCNNSTEYYVEDGSAATQNIIIAARLYGLKSCWIGGCKGPYYENEDMPLCEGVPCKMPPVYDDLCTRLKEIVKAPMNLDVISIVSLGYSDEDFTAQKRPLTDLLHWNHYTR